MEKQGKKEAPPLYYFYGEEDYLVERGVEEVRARVFSASGRSGGAGFDSMNYDSFNAKEADLQEVLAICMTMPAFSPRRVVVLRGADSIKKKADLELLLEYVKDPSPSTCLVFTADSWKASKSSKLFEGVKKAGVVRACKRLGEGELIRWVTDDAGKQGKKISRDAAARLVSLVGTSLRDVKGELDKIILYVGDGEEVDVRAVVAACSEVKDETAFDLTDAIGRRDTAGAMKILRKIEREEPLRVLGAIVWQFRILMKIKGLHRRGEPKGSIQRSCGAPYSYFEKYYQGSARFSEGALVRAFKAFARVDRELKSSGLPGGLVMSRLVMELCRVR